MKKITIALLVGLTLSLGIFSCTAETLTQMTDVFELIDNGQTLQMVASLNEGAEYEPLEYLMAQPDSAFDSYYYSNAPTEWIRISYQDGNGYTRQGWIVANPDVITGTKYYPDFNSEEEYNGYDSGIYCSDFREEYNGYDSGVVLCESLSLREGPDAAYSLIDTLPYGEDVTILEENESWYHVTYRDPERPNYTDLDWVSGWVRKEYVLMNPDYFTPDRETPVYAIPSSGSKRVGLISGGTSYPIIEEFNGFLAISLRGASGFVVKP